MDATETIVAIATAAGPGGIGIVRLSGPAAARIGAAISGRPLRPRHAHHVGFVDADGQVIDDGIVVAFPAPRSYTGEDVVELQAHGSPALLAVLLRRCLELGARPARPGEFTERAWRHGRLDLAQAEAVADLIAAGSEAAARAARRSLEGEFSRRIGTLQAGLTALRVHVEAAIDFPEEEIDFLADAVLARRLAQVREDHASLLAQAAHGQRLRDGLHVVIAGAPNAGKSSLLNALAGCDRAIVTPHAGTTRDLLREAVRIGGVEVMLVDTAGVRASSDAIEREGIRRARAEWQQADLVLALVDATTADTDREPLASALVDAPAVWWLYTKADLVASGRPAAADDVLWISTRDGTGLDALRQRLQQAAGGDGGGAFSARARHVEALRRTGHHLDRAAIRLQAEQAGDLAAEELRLAQHELGQITGEGDSEALLGEIFASFCIGK